MTDDVKAAVERFRGLIASLSGGYLRAASRSCGGYNAHNYDDDICRDCGFDGMNPAGEMLLGEAQDLLAHIDGEKARQDAAVAAAREEQREVDLARLDHEGWDHIESAAQALRDAEERIKAVTLTATPLADRIAELENYFTHARDLALEFDRRLLVEIGEHAETTAELLDTQTRAEEAEAERDALRAQVAKMEAQAKEDGAAVARCLLVNERLRAQVEAAIKTAEAIRADEDTPSGWGREVAWRILRAMDGAKP